MSENTAKGEMHGCIVCGKLYQLYVIYDAKGNYLGSRVMSAGGREVSGAGRPLVACEKHSDHDVERAVKRVFGDDTWAEDD
ncbi:MAG TPA: hypothetical protein VNK49_02765 [Anaerolineales bacterium]|nr:hypothetical protein [Anaerolineales bacterium]